MTPSPPTPAPSPPILPQSPYSDPEKGSDIQIDQGVADHPDRRSWLQIWLNDPRHWRPMLIAVGPIHILCFIWIFFGVTFASPVALPDYLALKANAHAQSATMVVSIVATVVASVTTYFFSLAIRYVISIRLSTTATSLDVLTSATRIAQKSLWIHSPKAKWTWVVLFAYLGVSFQTSALTSFLTIRPIPAEHSLIGNDLHMGDPSLLQLARQSTLGLTYYQLTSFFLQNIMIHSLQVERNLSSTFNFNGYTYLTTTGGIQPATIVPTRNQHLTTNANLFAPANLKDPSSAIVGHLNLPLNKTMQLTQQGFTADVDCRIGNSQDQAKYPSTFGGTPLSGTNNFELVLLNVTCPGGQTQLNTNRPVLVETDSDNIGVVFTAACPIPNTSNYDVIIRTTGPYAALDRTVCTISPKVTTVDVIYRNSTQGPMTISVSPAKTETDGSVWGEMAVEMLLFDVLLGQSVIGSAIGNAWLLTPGAQVNTTLPQVMNTYLKAAVEFTGTVVRQLFTQPDSPFIPGGTSGLSSSMQTPIQGTFTLTTAGWSQDRVSSPLFLLPTTVLCLATYGLLVYGIVLARKDKGDFQKEDADFDPTDIVHVIAAHAPETRRNEFKSFSDEQNAYIRQTTVKMHNRQGVRAFEVVPNDGTNGQGTFVNENGEHGARRDSRRAEGVRDSGTGFSSNS
ncbi:hypothetical protein P691DRAFT_810012 [Macrolepiota fuliginosa MF-IS2]|uniref:Uncharacterized protein n=1 Tax=Macrolepiota fuliginosa MF-IS2 TaxID=1400762 RepID=A0A9P6C691_9AGAR|nr:hypothetical protein P691DRAFT_810012 [Macrolepiota fuliginosa MF-IS2]